jgi:hypothetical protein
VEEKINVIYDPRDGSYTVDVECGTGESCKAKTKNLEQVLAQGKTEVEVFKKPEWHETEEEGQVHETRQGW